jgi:hypothetical protein
VTAAALAEARRVAGWRPSTTAPHAPLGALIAGVARVESTATPNDGAATPERRAATPTDAAATTNDADRRREAAPSGVRRAAGRSPNALRTSSERTFLLHWLAASVN